MTVAIEQFHRLQAYRWNEERKSHEEVEWNDPDASWFRIFYHEHGWSTRNPFVLSFDERDLAEDVSRALQRAWVWGANYKAQAIRAELGLC